VKGLTALWREGLLAQKVLRGKTRGYRRHPQLERFRAQRDPVKALGAFLSEVHREAFRRGYDFDRKKILRYATRRNFRIPVTRGQVRFEWRHLLSKLKKRDLPRYEAYRRIRPSAHPIFRAHSGGIESWEKTVNRSR